MAGGVVDGAVVVVVDLSTQDGGVQEEYVIFPVISSIWKYVF